MASRLCIDKHPAVLFARRASVFITVWFFCWRGNAFFPELKSEETKNSNTRHQSFERQAYVLLPEMKVLFDPKQTYVDTALAETVTTTNDKRQEETELLLVLLFLIERNPWTITWTADRAITWNDSFVGDTPIWLVCRHC
jgi:hypothetical protein